MRYLIATLSLTIAVLLGSAGVSESAEPIKGYCLLGTKHSHYPILGKCSDSYESGDFATALREWTPLAEQGYADAQSNLGLMYYNGDGVPQDYKTAEKWFRLAAEQGLADAQLKLGHMYTTKVAADVNSWAFIKVIPEDYETAAKWYRLAAEQGNADAQYSLGKMYEGGEGVSGNYETAMKWYRLAAEQGHARAQYILGVLHTGVYGSSSVNVTTFSAGLARNS